MIISRKRPKEQDRKYAAGEFVAEPSGDVYAIGNFNWPRNRRVVLKNNELAAIGRFRTRREGWLRFFAGFDRSVEIPGTGEVVARWDWQTELKKSLYRLEGFLEIADSNFKIYNRPKSPDVVKSEPVELISIRKDFQLMIPTEFEKFDSVILMVAHDIHSEFWSLRYGGSS